MVTFSICRLLCCRRRHHHFGLIITQPLSGCLFSFHPSQITVPLSHSLSFSNFFYRCHLSRHWFFFFFFNILLFPTLVCSNVSHYRHQFCLACGRIPRELQCKDLLGGRRNYVICRFEIGGNVFIPFIIQSLDGNILDLDLLFFSFSLFSRKSLNKIS